MVPWEYVRSSQTVDSNPKKWPITSFLALCLHKLINDLKPLSNVGIRFGLT